MRKILPIFLIVAAVLFTAIWIAAQRLVMSALATLGTDASSPLTFQDHDVSGFPATLNATLQNPEFSDNDTDFTWRSPTLNVSANSFWPTQITTSFPPEQSVDFNGVPLTLSSEDITLTTLAGMNLSLPLRSILLAGTDLSLSDVSGQDMRVASLDAAFVRTDAEEPVYDLDASIAEITLPSVILETLNHNQPLPDVLEGITLDATLTLDSEISRLAAETIPQITNITVDEAQIRWGTVAMGLQGALTVDPSGLPTGVLTVTITDWEQLLDIAITAGVVPANNALTLRAVASSMASGSPDLTAPITVRDGMASFGLIPLGSFRF